MRRRREGRSAFNTINTQIVGLSFTFSELWSHLGMSDTDFQPGVVLTRNQVVKELVLKIRLAMHTVVLKQMPNLYDLDHIIEIKSMAYAEVWLELLLLYNAKYKCLLACVQWRPATSLRRSAAATGGVLSAGGAAYAPLIAGEEAPHKTTRDSGHVKASSFGQIELSAGFELRQSGVGEAAGLSKRRDRPALVGGVFDYLFDGFLGVEPVGTEDGGRFDPEHFCREACEDEELQPPRGVGYELVRLISGDHVHVAFDAKIHNLASGGLMQAKTAN